MNPTLGMYCYSAVMLSIQQVTELMLCEPEEISNINLLGFEVLIFWDVTLCNQLMMDCAHENFSVMTYIVFPALTNYIHTYRIKIHNITFMHVFDKWGSARW
jgi:hypothetical protein